MLLAPSGSGRLIFMVVIEQVCHTAELFCRSLQSLDLLAQLRLFSLFLVQHLVDIPHGFSLLVAL